MRSCRSGWRTLLAAPILTVRRERKGRQAEDDIRPAILALSVTGPNGHLRAELATHPRGVRPGDLVAALGTDAVPGRACRTHQWIERDGARFEPLPLSGPGTGDGRDTAREEGFPSCPRRKSARPRRVPPGRQRAALARLTRRRPAPRQAEDRRHPAGALRTAAAPSSRRPSSRWCGPPTRAQGGPDRRGGPEGLRPTIRGRRGAKRSRSRRRSGPGPALQAGRPLPGLRARAAPHDPDRHARGPLAGRALRVPGRRRHQPDRRQRLPGPGPERAARHGGRLRRHRDPQERRPLPGRRALRPGRHRGRDVVAAAPDRGRAQGGADHPVPGDQEPDRGQGRPPDPGGLAARPLRRPGAQLERLRDLQAPRATTSAAGCAASSTRSSRPATA